VAVELFDILIYCRNSGDSIEDSVTSEYQAFVKLSNF